MPFELFPLEPEPDGTILYPDAQYVIMGSSADFMPACIDGVDVRLAESHPVTDIDAPHFVIEAGPLRLKWIVRRD